MVNLMTWNTEGGREKFSRLRGLLNEYEIDVCCLQECGRGTGQLADVQPTGSGKLYRLDQGSRHPSYYMYFYPWSDAGKVNPAVMWRVELFDPDTRPELDDRLRFVERVFPKSRPALGVAIDGLGLEFYTLHAVSGGGGGNDVPGLVRRISKGSWTKWVAAGDFNAEPHVWGATKPQLAGTVWPPDGVTRPQSNARYDYAVSMSSMDSRTGSVKHAGVSDHRPVVYSF